MEPTHNVASRPIRLLPYHFPQFSSTSGLGRAAVQAWLLGVTGTLSVVALFASSSNDNKRLAAYFLAVTIFHTFEFLVTAVFNPTVTTADSFLLNHSRAYGYAHLLALAEWMARYSFGSFATTTHDDDDETVFSVFFALWSIWTWRTGLVLTGTGQMLRTGAMVRAGPNFHHLIQNPETTSQKRHRLVTTGIYRYMRHPSYAGFFWYTVGTQLLLGNVVATAALTMAAQRFFATRIPYEESTLYQRHPEAYRAYRERTWWSGVPGVN